MADRLVVVSDRSDRRYGFRIQWKLDDEFDTGGYLGQSKNEPGPTAPKDKDDLEPGF